MNEKLKPCPICRKPLRYRKNGLLHKEPSDYYCDSCNKSFNICCVNTAQNSWNAAIDEAVKVITTDEFRNVRIDTYISDKIKNKLQQLKQEG